MRVAVIHRPTYSICEGYGLPDTNLRDALNEYVLEKRQMIVSYLLYLRWSAASIPHATSLNFR